MSDKLDLRCSVVARSLGERPAGSAGSWHRVILVELPLPWPDAIEHHPLLASGDLTAVDGRDHRVLALASALSPEDATPDDGLRVICYWRPVGAPFQEFTRAEICAPDADVGEIVENLIGLDDRELATIPPDAFASGPASEDHAVRDLLVCTHGTRDRCCGKFGTELFRSLEGRVPAGVRLWRTSHTGGHRFAPTGLCFPDGGTWAGLDEAFTLGLVDRTIPAVDAAAHARGSAGVDDAPSQVADAAGLAHVGWSWLDDARTFTVVDEAKDGVVTVLVEARDRRFRAVVAPGRTVPVPPCGKPLDEATKSTIEWDLLAFDEE